MIGRRTFLQLLAGAGLGALDTCRSPSRALAFGDFDKLQIGQILYSGGNPTPRPNAMRRLMWELDKRTSIEVRADAAPVRLSDGAELFRYPLLYLAGDRGFP